MPRLLQKALQLLTGSAPQTGDRPFKSLTERDLIRLESEIGAELFGPVPAGHERSFFNLDERTWIWYEEWRDPSDGKQRSATVRYEVHDNGILKVQEGARYSFIDGQELANFTVATQMYYERALREVYRRDPATGQKLA